MGIRLNGSSYLYWSGSMPATTQPLALLIYAAVDGPAAGSQYFCALQNSGASDTTYGIFTNNSVSAVSGERGAAGTATKTYAPPSASYALYVYNEASTTSRSIWAGSSSSPGTDSTNTPNTLASLNRISIGGLDNAGLGLRFPTTGSVAEFHIVAGLDTAQLASLYAGTIKPDELTGWVCGWQLKTASDLTDMGGTRTLTVGGSVTTSGIAHPVSRGDTTPPTLTSPTGTGGTLTCSGTVSTNEANGTLYTSFTGSATAPTAVQVEAGQDHTGAAALRAVSQAVSATGTQTVASGSITAGTRYAHFMHKDAAGNRSTVVSSSSFTVTSGASGPTINTQPSNQTVTAPATATFTVSATASAGSLTYQWRRNGTNISGAVSASYTTPATTVTGGTANNGDVYSVVVTDSNGSTTSSNATLTVNASGGVSGTLTLTDFSQWTGSGWASITVPFVKIFRASTGVLALELASQPVNASGNMVITNAAITAGVTYCCFGFNTDGTLSFKKTAVAT